MNRFAVLFQNKICRAVFFLFSSSVFFNNLSNAQVADYTRIVENIAPSIVSIVAIVDKNFEHPSQSGSVVPASFETSLSLGSNTESSVHTHNGTGIILTSDGFVVTNQHIVQGGISYLVVLENGFQYVADYIGSDAISDLAVLKIHAENLSPGVFSDDEKAIKAGQRVLGFGSPFLLSGSVTQGIISYVNRPLPIMGNYADYIVFIQTNLLINPGNSGGPVVNEQGEIIGINSSLLSSTVNSSGIAIAIPATVVKNISNQLMNNGLVVRRSIGVNVENIPSSRAISLGLETPKGALVTDVELGGPAERAGVRNQDVIVAVNQQVINNRYELIYRISLLEEDEPAQLSIIRDRKYFSTMVLSRELLDL
tara:strand:+ start:764 stop:1864 length:1101 start_codon:yes stop_codon:yes gene_type:complete